MSAASDQAHHSSATFPTPKNALTVGKVRQSITQGGMPSSSLGAGVGAARATEDKLLASTTRLLASCNNPAATVADPTLAVKLSAVIAVSMAIV
jgi:hypothetical protein